MRCAKHTARPCGLHMYVTHSSLRSPRFETIHIIAAVMV